MEGERIMERKQIMEKETNNPPNTADELIVLAEITAKRAGELAADTEKKLSRIQRPRDLTESQEIDRASETGWPPLFNDIRGNLRIVQNSLELIRINLERAEI